MCLSKLNSVQIDLYQTIWMQSMFRVSILILDNSNIASWIKISIAILKVDGFNIENHTLSTLIANGFEMKLPYYLIWYQRTKPKRVFNPIKRNCDSIKNGKPKRNTILRGHVENLTSEKSRDLTHLIT